MQNRGPGLFGGYSTDQTPSSTGYFSSAPQVSCYQSGQSENRPLAENPHSAPSSYFSESGQQQPLVSHGWTSYRTGYDPIGPTECAPCCVLL